jgi:hypothetical protein
MVVIVLFTTLRTPSVPGTTYGFVTLVMHIRLTVCYVLSNCLLLCCQLRLNCLMFFFSQDKMDEFVWVHLIGWWFKV